jgi:5-methylcytosine-specific restriction protein A
MAQRPLSKCPAAGCRELTRNGRCEKHKKEKRTRSVENRGNSTERGYGADWQRLRGVKLKHDPLCADCLEEGRTYAGQDYNNPLEVHHIEKVADEPEMRLDLDNLMTLCRVQHSIRTARGE